ncbi:MAG: DNA mismatch repair endonuclease MutL [Ruminococcus sp.]|nr:DNA mismatch repair endonuclease MutL [Ruminococcus sp.]
MGRINVLQKHVAELIAAGEVVERPCSVIKELVENSIDAGAKSITVEIKNGGTTFMRVTDDGMGIMRDDIRNAFLRHATSKVCVQDDLDSIATLGFRGEALASVSAVAKVELITCADCEDVGSSYIIEGGEEVSFTDAGCPVGTTIVVRDLFYNIPARQKFLKKDVAEGNAVSLVMDRIALSHPEIAFTFIRDSKQTLKTAGDGKLRSAIYAVYGREFSNSLIEVDYELDGIRVEGFISRPEYSRPNRNMQTFFVNNRYVKSRTAGAAVDEAAKGSVMVGKFLCCVLNIKMSFSAVDVNVHPAKIEVRFVNERPLFNAVYHAVKSALIKGDKRKEAVLLQNTPAKRVDPFAQFDLRTRDVARSQPEVTSKPPESVHTQVTPMSAKPSVTPDSVTSGERTQSSTPAYQSKFTPFYQRRVTVADSGKVDNYLSALDIIAPPVQEDVPVSPETPIVEATDTQEISPVHSESLSTSPVEQEITPDNAEVNNEPQDITLTQEPQAPEFKYLGEAFRTYIIVEVDKELILIDKHALHERMIYEQLKKEADSCSQLLLVPVTVVLDKAVYTAVIDNLDMLSECGFDVEDFGMPTLLVRSAPQYITGEDISDTITEMADYIAENKKDIRSEKMDWIFHNIACRAAIKAGNKSTDMELMDLARKMLSDDSLRYCPHGRPVCIVLKKSEIEKQFGRA